MTGTSFNVYWHEDGLPEAMGPDAYVDGYNLKSMMWHNSPFGMAFNNNVINCNGGPFRMGPAESIEECISQEIIWDSIRRDQ